MELIQHLIYCKAHLMDTWTMSLSNYIRVLYMHHACKPDHTRPALLSTSKIVRL